MFQLGGFLSGGSNPLTPRLQSQPVSSPSLRCRTTMTATAPTPPAHDTLAGLQCKTTTRSPRFFQGSNPSSPRSPLRFPLFKTSLRLSKSSCGICVQSVKTSHGMNIFMEEFSHAFHFPCITAHVRKHGSLVCPVCNTNWREVPLLAIHKNQPPIEENEHDIKPCSVRDVKTKQYQKDSKSSDPRVYEDDEPLLSPTDGARFVPIPKVDDNGEEVLEDKIEEFQGFFVNPNSSSSIKTTIDGRDLRNGDGEGDKGFGCSSNGIEFFSERERASDF